MDSNFGISFHPREFTRREKTCIRQDVKRFEKIGRDHHCDTFEDYVDFVRNRLKFDEDEQLTLKSYELFRGLTAYFGDQLLRNTAFQRVAGEAWIRARDNTETQLGGNALPGWLLFDAGTGQLIYVSWIVLEQVLVAPYRSASLDDIFDEIIDWNHGYLLREDLHTSGVGGPDVGLEDYLAA